MDAATAFRARRSPLCKTNCENRFRVLDVHVLNLLRGSAPRCIVCVFALMYAYACAMATAPPKASNASGRTVPSRNARRTPPSLISPKPSQLDLQVEGLFGFTGPGSIVRVREFQTEGTGLHFSSTDMNTQQMPTLDVRYWFNDVNAIHFRFRYFNLGGTRFSSTPIKYNGAIIPGRRTNTFDPWEWFSGGLYYERRLTPLYQSYEDHWPSWLQGWDLRGRIGIEYTYLYYDINGDSTFSKRAPGGEETAEDFYHQSMPLPTIGLEAWRQISDKLLFQGEVSDNWINRWNSLRN
jgi:hypothetical protein